MNNRKVGKLKKGFNWIYLVVGIILGLYCLMLIAPLIWSLLTSFKGDREFRADMISFPKSINFENYAYVFSRYYVPVEGGVVDIFGMFANSILYALGSAIANTFTLCMTAYLCARYNFKFSKIIYTIVIVTMALPIVGNLPSEIQVASFFGLKDNIWFIWIMKANFLGMYFLVFYSYFKKLPKAYTEAAQIDGANHFQIFFKIAFPLVSLLFGTILLINFITFWNDYQTPLIYLPNKPTAMLGVYSMVFSTDTYLATKPRIMTSIMLVCIPVITLFSIFHKRLMGNLTIGGVKG